MNIPASCYSGGLFVMKMAAVEDEKERIKSFLAENIQNYVKN